ncbi:class I SAM-dependent rRNA methyltransferase [Stagnimonas aquatica]|uniref:Class I SAM-dependent rRNA methyltransferase n=1 Tax=Stagnimonas aquatica TaxID=2689987 RepID=A0A3N0V8K3_9GAMM|nr:class I SAM-dependent rRNA methyltransferase [Stagnimonas aquatica]ROH89083.1 class I SAM-dependent rRNA methyltransferase [Stagnimonas aquatica]
MHSLRLKAHEERRLRAGHLWAYSNEIDTAVTPLKGLKPGTLCRLEDARGKALGVGYVHPNVLLSVRLLSGQADALIDREWFERRLRQALSLRERLYPSPHYRLVFGESDGLPGLVIDRYGDLLSVQLTTAGMEALKEPLLEALQRLLKPKGILFRNDNAMRQTEGLPSEDEVWGEVPEEVELLESGVRLLAPLRAGQKTGFFYDQHANRDRVLPYVRGARVLDVFSYVGGWAARAAAAGATSVACIDSSELALDYAARNMAAQGAAPETLRGDALDLIKQLRAEGRQFDVVVVDPPALIKRKKDEEAGQAHYAALNRAAMHLLAADGILVSCSCSHHLSEEQLQRILLRESRQAGRRLQILERGGQGPDHPVHPAIPETLYLKAFYCRATVG